MYLKTTRYKQFDSIEIKESLFKEFTLPNHFHDSYCIGLLGSGIKTSIVEENNYVIHANSVTIVNPYQIHSDKNFDKDASHFRMIYINKDVLNFIAKKHTGKSDNNILFTNDLITDPLVSEAILAFFNQIPHENLLENKLMCLLELLIEKYTKQHGIDTAKKSEYLNAINDAIEYARLNFADKINIEKMAMDCKLSKYQFIRYFKKMTGLTPASYIIICRLHYAKSLLIKGFPIGELALEAGFYDHPQFCKFFKYYAGLSPIEYRRSCNIIQGSSIK